MPRSATAIALAALALGAARAEDQCAEGQCDAQEEAALLQHAAAKSAKVSAHSFANTTETRTVTCYPWAESSCGASKQCILDTTGCTSSGGGCGCMAAGTGAGLQQCRFCDTGDGCGADCTPQACGNTAHPCEDPTPACVGGAKSYTCTGKCAVNVVQLTQKTCGQMVEDMCNTWSYSAQQATCDVGKGNSECSCMTDACATPTPAPPAACGNLRVPCEAGQTCVGGRKSYKCVQESCAIADAGNGQTCGDVVSSVVTNRGDGVDEASQWVGCTYSSCQCMAEMCGNSFQPCCNMDVCVGAAKSYQCTGSCANNMVQLTSQTCAQMVNQIVGTWSQTVQEATCSVGRSHTECSCMTQGCPATR